MGVFGHWIQIQYFGFESLNLRAPTTSNVVWLLCFIFELKSIYCANDTEIYFDNNILMFSFIHSCSQHYYSI